MATPRSWGAMPRYDPKLLSPIQHRSPSAQLDLAVIRVRERLLAARTMLVNASRGIVKSSGYRLRSCSTESFAKQSRSQVPKVLSEILIPRLDQIATLTEQIRGFDQRIEQMAESKYPETKVLRGVKGVGALTAMSFVLTVGDARRFGKSRDVGCYRVCLPVALSRAKGIRSWASRRQGTALCAPRSCSALPEGCPSLGGAFGLLEAQGVRLRGGAVDAAVAGAPGACGSGS